MWNRQFTLRASMVVIAALGLLLAWVRSRGSFLHALIELSHSVVTWGLCLAIASALARAHGPTIGGRRARVAAWVGLALAASCSLYLAWGHYRTTHYFLERDYPYPDPAINALERWFDARRPVAPGSLKLHGEYPLVGFVFGLLVLAFASLTGLILGVLRNRPRA